MYIAYWLIGGLAALAVLLLVLLFQLVRLPPDPASPRQEPVNENHGADQQ